MPGLTLGVSCLGLAAGGGGALAAGLFVVAGFGITAAGELIVVLSCAAGLGSTAGSCAVEFSAGDCTENEEGGAGAVCVGCCTVAGGFAVAVRLFVERLRK